MNKRRLAFLMLCMCVIVSFTGCSDDDGYKDVDGQSPAIALTADHIQTAAGRQFTIEGTVTDKDGISTIGLVCADLYLNKTIDLIEIYDEPLTTYELKYSFKVQANEIGEQFTVKVIVTDVGGRSVSHDVLVTLDGDFENPTFTASPAEQPSREMPAALKKKPAEQNLTLPITLPTIGISVRDNAISCVAPRSLDAKTLCSLAIRLLYNIHRMVKVSRLVAVYLT